VLGKSKNFTSDPLKLLFWQYNLAPTPTSQLKKATLKISSEQRSQREYYSKLQAGMENERA
jgi:hypothetical protein